MALVSLHATTPLGHLIHSLGCGGHLCDDSHICFQSTLLPRPLTASHSYSMDILWSLPIRPLTPPTTLYAGKRSSLGVCHIALSWLFSNLSACSSAGSLYCAHLSNIGFNHQGSTKGPLSFSLHVLSSWPFYLPRSHLLSL